MIVIIIIVLHVGTIVYSTAEGWAWTMMTEQGLIYTFIRVMPQKRMKTSILPISSVSKLLLMNVR